MNIKLNKNDEKLRFPAIIAIIFILISPTELVAETEKFYYLVLGVVLMIYVFFIKRKIRIVDSLLLVLYIFWAWITCIWTPSTGYYTELLVKTITIAFLFFQLQFDYSHYEIEKIKDAFLWQLVIIVIIIILFGSTAMDGRLWLVRGESSTDPNCIVGWVLIPLSIALQRIFDLNRKFFSRVLMFLGAVTAIIICFATASRSGTISMLVIVVFSILYIVRLYILKKPLVSIIVIIFAIILAIVVYNNIPIVMQNRFNEASSNTFGGRLTIWRVLFTALNQSPLHYIIGFGENSVNNYTSFLGRGHIAHNTFLDILFCQGIIGLIPVCVFLFKCLKNTFKNDKCVFILLCGIIILANTLNTFSQRFFLLMFFIAGIIKNNARTNEYYGATEQPDRVPIT